MFDSRTNLSLQVVEEVKRCSKHQCTAHRAKKRKIRGGSSYGLPITIYDPKSKGAESYRALAELVINKEWK